MAPDPSFAGYSSLSEGPLLAGPMLGEVGETFARVWFQARDESPLTLTLHHPEGDRPYELTPSAQEWLCGVFQIDDLAPGQSHEYTLSSENGETGRYRLSTAPAASARRLRVAFGSCFFYHDRPAPAFDAAREGRPDVFVMAGDNCYYVQEEWLSAERMMLAQLRNRNHADFRRLGESTPVLGIWDDHDFGPDDSDGTFANKAVSLPIFRRLWAQRTYGTDAVTGIFSTVRMGPVELFLLDGRYARIQGRQILGQAQLAWLFERLEASSAPVKLLVSGSQVLPEAAATLGWECWRRDAPGELEQLVTFLSAHDIRGVVLASGDVHLGYLLHEAGRHLPGGRVGPELWELTSSPLANDTWTDTIARLGRPDRFIVTEHESENYGIIDVDLDRAGQEIRLVLEDAHGGVLVNQPIAIDQLRVRPAAAVRPPLPHHAPAPAPEKLCPVVWSNGKAYFFAGVRYVRYDLAEGRVDRAFPQAIATFWRGIWPGGIDAAVPWNNGKAYFFKGSRYYAFDVARDHAEPGPRDVATYFPGLWRGGIDAGIVWSNGKAYFFKGSEYLRYDLALDRADPGYPKPIADGWKGLWPDGVDGACVGPDGAAYFFKGGDSIRHDMSADEAEPPRAIEERWPGVLGALGLGAGPIA
ncbi:MAG: hemopexin repeat-containing protein [Byssovorax sp.]